MKNKIIRSLTFLTLAGIILSLTAWAIASSRHQNSAATQADSPRRKSLHEIAQARDVEIDVPELENMIEYEDIRILAKHAQAIVIAQLTDEESAFDGGDHILTSYRLNVQSVLKPTELNAPLGVGDESPAPLVTPVKLVRPGGVVMVGGHRANSKLKGSEPLKPGGRFLLFLWWSPSYKAYTLAGGVSGAFLIGPDQHLKPLGSKAGIRKYDGDHLQAVLDEVLTSR